MSHQVESKGLYFSVFIALVILTGITVWVAFLDLGILNNVVALGIATIKATLVVLFFMNVRHSNHLTWIFIGSGILFLIILLAFTMSDVLTRKPVILPGLG